LNECLGDGPRQQLIELVPRVAASTDLGLWFELVSAAYALDSMLAPTGLDNGALVRAVERLAYDPTFDISPRAAARMQVKVERLLDELTRVRSAAGTVSQLLAVRAKIEAFYKSFLLLLKFRDLWKMLSNDKRIVEAGARYVRDRRTARRTAKGLQIAVSDAQTQTFQSAEQIQIAKDWERAADETDRQAQESKEFFHWAWGHRIPIRAQVAKVREGVDQARGTKHTIEAAELASDRVLASLPEWYTSCIDHHDQLARSIMQRAGEPGNTR
jgi:hypothetical protein